MIRTYHNDSARCAHKAVAGREVAMDDALAVQISLVNVNHERTTRTLYHARCYVLGNTEPVGPGERAASVLYPLCKAPAVNELCCASEKGW
jgi:hypothetical protein